MKLKLSNLVESGDKERVNPDADTINRIREKALKKAGFPSEHVPRRRIGRRSALLLASAMAVVMLFATALATTDLGERLSEYFRLNTYVQNMLDTMEEYGEPIGVASTDQNITFTLDAAYANEAECIMVLTAEDADNRLGEGMSVWPSIVSDVEHGGSVSHYTPSLSDDGKAHFMIVAVGEESYQGMDVRLEIDSITPGSTTVEEHPIGLTLGELLTAKRSLPIMLEDIGIMVGAREGGNGLILTAAYPEKSGDRVFSVYDFTLKTADGRTLYSDSNMTTYGFEPTDSLKLENSFLLSAEEIEALSDAQVQLSYTVSDAPIEGDWGLEFTIPRDEAVFETLAVDRIATVDGFDFRIGEVYVYPSCVIVEYETVLTGLHELDIDYDEDEDWWIYEQGYSFPTFRLTGEGGKELTGISYDTWASGATKEGREWYKAVIHCLTTGEEELTLQVLDSSNYMGESTVVLAQKLR